MNLVVGATGNVGGAVCEALRGQDMRVRALSTAPARLSPRARQVGSTVSTRA